MFNEKKHIILSGVQPSGPIHLGNYLGAIINWTKMISSPDHISSRFLFMLADLHTMTTGLSINQNDIVDLVISYIACGVDGKNNNVSIFQQSKIPFHLELMWILSCITPLGWLERMTQFKDKSQKNDQNINLGLLSYPVLMASDILLYRTTIVPVGADQVQHVEFVRDIARRTNHLVKKEVFVSPEIAINSHSVSRIMSLTDGTRKMSKSDADRDGCIYLTDTDETIQSKIKNAKTDSEYNLYYDKEKRPEIANLLNIFSAVSGNDIDDLLKIHGNRGHAKFKNALSDALIEHISPIRTKIIELKKDLSFIEEILLNGRSVASNIAKNTINSLMESIQHLKNCSEIL